MEKEYKSISIRRSVYSCLIEEAERRGMKIRELATRCVSASLKTKIFLDEIVGDNEKQKRKVK